MPASSRPSRYDARDRFNHVKIRDAMGFHERNHARDKAQVAWMERLIIAKSVGHPATRKLGLYLDAQAPAN